MSEKEPARPETDSTHYQAAFQFGGSFMAAGVSVLVAVYAYAVAGFLTAATESHLPTWEWLWGPPILLFTLLCFFNHYWLTNTLGFLRPMDNRSIYMLDVWGFFSGCLWCLTIRLPWFWGLFAASLFRVSFYRTEYVLQHGPLSPLSRGSREWVVFAKAFDQNRMIRKTLLWILIVLVVLHLALRFVLKWEAYLVTLAAFGMIFVTLGTYLNWFLKLGCPFFPLSSSQAAMVDLHGEDSSPADTTSDS